MELAPEGYDEARVLEKVRHIAHTVHEILDLAARQDISTYRTAIRLAEQQLEAARQTRGSDPAVPHAAALVP